MLLLQLLGVRNVAVALKTGPDEVPQLIAYLIRAVGYALPQAALRAYLRIRLAAAYIVPAPFVEMRSFLAPTRNKIDRKALPYPQAMKPEPARALAAPPHRSSSPFWQQRFGTVVIFRYRRLLRP